MFCLALLLGSFENHPEGTTTYPGTETDKKPKCVDINECIDTVSVCSVENECQNTFGSYYCECNPGYQYNEETDSCDDIDECSPTGFICSGRADSTDFVCINTVGSYNCHCKPGLDTGGLGECLDWNECFSQGFKWTMDYEPRCSLLEVAVQESHSSGTHECDDNSECVNFSGSFECQCKDGFAMNATMSCIDVDECLTDPCDDSEICENTEGSYNCDCHEGYQREKTNQKNCIDIDECALGLHNCGVNTECLNRPNYFQCPCKVGYEMIRNRCTGPGLINANVVLSLFEDTQLKI